MLLEDEIEVRLENLENSVKDNSTILSNKIKTTKDINIKELMENLKKLDTNKKLDYDNKSSSNYRKED